MMNNNHAMEAVSAVSTAVNNAGYNYYYGVTDNTDLIKWMKDIDLSINRLYEFSDSMQDEFNDRSEYIEDLVIKHSRQIKNIKSSLSLLGWGTLFGAAAVGILYWIVNDLQDQHDELKSEVDKLVDDMKPILRDKGFKIEV